MLYRKKIASTQNIQIIQFYINLKVNIKIKGSNDLLLWRGKDEMKAFAPTHLFILAAPTLRSFRLVRQSLPAFIIQSFLTRCTLLLQDIIQLIYFLLKHFWNPLLVLLESKHCKNLIHFCVWFCTWYGISFFKTTTPWSTDMPPISSAAEQCRSM